MPTITSTYLLPAILLNPALILHIVNTFVSHIMPPPLTVSHSPHPFMESIGPVPGSTPYLDMHADDQLCWRYTVVMVFVQIFAFGRVQDNRVARKTAKAAKLEREKMRKEKLKEESTNGAMKTMNGSTKSNGYATRVDNTGDFPNEIANGASKENNDETAFDESSSETTLTDISEEEMIV